MEQLWYARIEYDLRNKDPDGFSPSPLPGRASRGLEWEGKFSVGHWTKER